MFETKGKFNPNPTVGRHIQRGVIASGLSSRVIDVETTSRTDACEGPVTFQGHSICCGMAGRLYFKTMNGSRRLCI